MSADTIDRLVRMLDEQVRATADLRQILGIVEGNVADARANEMLAEENLTKAEQAIAIRDAYAAALRGLLPSKGKQAPVAPMPYQRCGLAGKP